MQTDRSDTSPGTILYPGPLSGRATGRLPAARARVTLVPTVIQGNNMIVWLGNEAYEVEELTNQLEFDIMTLEAIIEKLIQCKELYVKRVFILLILKRTE